jgi:hypothetical protein
MRKDPIDANPLPQALFNAIYERATPAERRTLAKKGGRLTGSRMTALAVDAALSETRGGAAGKALAMALTKWAARNLERSF